MSYSCSEVNRYCQTETQWLCVDLGLCFHVELLLINIFKDKLRLYNYHNISTGSPYLSTEIGLKVFHLFDYFLFDNNVWGFQWPYGLAGLKSNHKLSPLCGFYSHK